MPFAAILVNCARSGEMHNYCIPHIIKENFENFLIHRCNYILLSNVYCVWQVVKAPTIISNNPVYFGWLLNTMAMSHLNNKDRECMLVNTAEKLSQAPDGHRQDARTPAPTDDNFAKGEYWIRRITDGKRAEGRRAGAEDGRALSASAERSEGVCVWVYRCAERLRRRRREACGYFLPLDLSNNRRTWGKWLYPRSAIFRTAKLGNVYIWNKENLPFPVTGLLSVLT